MDEIFQEPGIRHLQLKRDGQFFIHIQSQFFAHFLRHSNSRLQRRQTFGANPFLVFAFIWRNLLPIA